MLEKWILRMYSCKRLSPIANPKYPPGDFIICQLVCQPDKEVRKQRHQMLTQIGVVVQHPDGSRMAVSPQEAEKHISRMNNDIRALYEES
jgi:hypothetical protein